MENEYSGVKWVWFDLDDTLFDFHTNSRLAHRALFDEEEGFGGAFDDFAVWLDAYETHNVEVWRRYSAGEISQEFLRMDRFRSPLLTRWKGSVESLESLCRKLDTRYLDLVAEQKTLIPGALEILETLRAKGYRLGILSNGFTETQHKKLELTGIGKLIDSVVLSDDIGVNKPDPRLYLYAMATVNCLEPQAHLMVGDNLGTDIKGACLAGWRRILFCPRGEGPAVPADMLPCRKIYSLSLLADLL